MSLLHAARPWSRRPPASALSRRVFTLPQVKCAVDCLASLHENRKLVGRRELLKEPPILRCFFGTLKPASGRQEALVAEFREDFGDGLQRPLLGVEQGLVLVRLEELVANRALEGLATGSPLVPHLRTSGTSLASSRLGLGNRRRSLSLDGQAIQPA